VGWPEWLLELVRGGVRGEVGFKRSPNKLIPLREGSRGDVGGVALAALRKLDPRDFASAGSQREFERWLGLMTACRYEGIARDDFVEWSTGDPEYAGHGEAIAQMWDATKPEHGGALWAAVWGVESNERQLLIRDPFKAKTPKWTPTINLPLRTKRITDWLKRDPSEGRLFEAGGMFAEIVREPRMKERTARDLLKSACQETGLWKSLGADRCQRTIDRAFQRLGERP
jgi:Primase C terminal 2 (PriCT-2)